MRSDIATRGRGRAPGRAALTPLRAWIALILAVLLTGSLLQPKAVAGLSEAHRDLGIHASVRLRILDGNGRAAGGCSGTVIDPAGYILTNFHCVGIVPHDPDRDGRRPGELYHPNGWLVIAPTKAEKQPPPFTYMAQFLAGRPEVDVAVLKIFRMVDAKAKLPAALPLPVMPLGDSDGVQSGEPVYVVGYPGAGGETITVTSGVVAGFDDLDDNGEADSIKTTALINGGNSGGLGMNDQGEQIGIATWGIADRFDPNDRLDRMMMINLAKPVIAQAKALAGPEVGKVPAAGVPPPAAPPAAAPPGPAAVSLTGRIVDADTKRPIAGARFTVLKPGATVAAWQKQGAAVELTSAITDVNGAYTTTTIPSGSSYSLVFTAKDYRTRGGDNILQLGAGQTGVTKVEEILLKKK